MGSSKSHSENRRNYSISVRMLLVAFSATFVAHLLTIDSALANRQNWFRFDSQHFVAYSTASEKKTRKILADLAVFRAAFIQIGSIAIPATTPKTRVVIVRTRSEFSKLAVGEKKFSNRRDILKEGKVGYAHLNKDGLILVLQVAEDLSWVKAVIQHEYGHQLLNFSDRVYPRWYQEGFSEIVATTELAEDGQSFIFGAAPFRALFVGQPIVEWDVLVADDFDPHQIVDAGDRFSAYKQAWLLAHFANLSNLSNAKKLQIYLNDMEMGKSSRDAFVEAFGVTASELWELELENYSQHMPAYRLQLTPGSLDLDFVRTAAIVSEYQPLIDYLQQRSIAYRRGKSPRNPLAHLSGQWSPISAAGNCKNIQQVMVNESDQTISFEYIVGDTVYRSVSGTFLYKPQENRAFTLTTIDADESSKEEASWRLEMRSKELLCLSRSASNDLSCEYILRKCLR